MEILPTINDLTPVLFVAFVLLCSLGLAMPFIGGRAARRRAAWARFDNLVRIKGVLPVDRESLSTWARLALPDNPHNVLIRRRDFDRFARSEVERLRGLTPQGFAFRLAQLGALRQTLGFDRSPGGPQSSNDLTVGELLDLRTDDNDHHLFRVLKVDEEAIHVSLLSPSSRRGIGAGWASFTRDGEGTYRFRTGLLREGSLAHGEFLVLDDRRRDPRINLGSGPFWVAVERLPDGAAPDDPEGVEVEAMDVSRGGLALLADRRVRRGSELGLDLPLGGPDGPLLRDVRAKVVGCGYREGGGHRPHFLHCRLLPLDDAQARVLSVFIEARVGGNGEG